MSRYYPIFLDLADRLCVVVGGGPVAQRKAAGLLEAGAEVRVVSPEATAELRDLAAQGRLELRLEAYRDAHLDGATLVFAATNVREINALVASDARSLNLPISVADSPEDGSFIVPSVVRRGDLCLAISTGGNNPMLSARLADEMEQRFGPEYAGYVELLGVVRDTIKEWTANKAERRAALAAVLDHEPEVRAHLVAARPQEALDSALAIARATIPSMPSA